MPSLPGCIILSRIWVSSWSTENVISFPHYLLNNIYVFLILLCTKSLEVWRYSVSIYRTIHFNLCTTCMCRFMHTEARVWSSENNLKGSPQLWGLLSFSTACSWLASLQASRAPSCLHPPSSYRNAGITGTHTTTPICTWVLGFKLRFTLALQAIHSLSCFPSWQNCLTTTP